MTPENIPASTGFDTEFSIQAPAMHARGEVRPSPEQMPRYALGLDARPDAAGTPSSRSTTPPDGQPPP